MNYQEISSIRQLAQGYTKNDQGPSYHCLFCDTSFEQGIIYHLDDTSVDAERAVMEHINREHDGVFNALLSLGKEGTGLTDIQRQVLELSHDGLNDKEIAAELGGKSASTIRNHRFQLRKKRGEAKVFLALMELLEAKAEVGQKFIDFHAAMPVKDERTMITEEEAEAILTKHFVDEERIKLVRFPKKQKMKLVILRHVATFFKAGRRYTEKEVNGILEEVNADFVTLRRYLVDYRFLARTRDGREYWLT